MNYEVIIVGLGPAAISNAIYLHRFGIKVLLIGGYETNLSLAKEIENYYGFESINGMDLFQKGIDQAKALGIDLKNEEVLSIEYQGSYKVITKENEYIGKRVVLATGKMRNKLQGLNYEEYEGNGLSYCAVCDAFFYRNKNIGIIGNTDYMYHELKVLEPLAKSITIFTNGKDLEDSNHKVCKEKILRFYGDTYLEGIECEGGKYDLDGCFVAIGSSQTFDFVKHLGIATIGSNIKVNDYETNCKNLYAIGDAIGGVLQITKASYDGMMLAYKLRKEIKNESEE